MPWRSSSRYARRCPRSSATSTARMPAALRASSMPGPCRATRLRIAVASLLATARNNSWTIGDVQRAESFEREDTTRSGMRRTEQLVCQQLVPLTHRVRAVGHRHGTALRIRRARAAPALAPVWHELDAHRRALLLPRHGTATFQLDAHLDSKKPGHPLCASLQDDLAQQLRRGLRHEDTRHT